MASQTAVYIVGARGYSGQVLVQLCQRHPEIKLAGLCVTDASWSPSETFPFLSGVPALDVDSVLNTLSKDDCVFLATPAGASNSLAPKFLDAGAKVIDLSGAFRLPPDERGSWYPLDWPADLDFSSIAFGIQPFDSPSQQTRLVSNPGCYATASMLALIPLLKASLIETDWVVVDAKSGVTGAGRKATESLLFSEVDEDFRAYRVFKHQHQPEIEYTCQRLTGQEVSLQFTTHLVPMKQGLQVSLYAKSKSTSLDIDTLLKAYQDAFEQDPFVRVEAFESDQGESVLAKTAMVKGSPYAGIACAVSKGQVFVSCVIDNLWKGAASQAIQNFNAIYGLDSWSGLVEVGDS
ncbi:MAG: N-acetyl-gamma-glutamyl-phosphate reductase [Bdellovibrionaceae bacterium]|nr:N-acetyl-gamma-glutamyl-phosphate reductase [Pseudobdellovibrionaceae bacterium]